MYLGLEKRCVLEILKTLLDINYIQKLPLYDDGNIIYLPDSYIVKIKKPLNKNGHKMKSLTNQSLF